MTWDERDASSPHDLPADDGRVAPRDGTPERPAPDVTPLADVASGNGVGAVAGRADGEDVEDALCQLLSDAFVRTDAHGIIRRANGAAAALLGRSLLWLQGKPLVTFVDDGQRHGLRTLLRELDEASGAQRWTLRLRAGDDRPVVVAATVVPVRGRRGGLTGARMVLRPLPDARADAPADALIDLRPAAVSLPSGLRPGDTTRYFVDFLTRATAVLGATLDQDVMLRGLAQAAVPALADWCFVDLVGPAGGLQRIAVEHTPLEDASLAAPLSAAPPADGLDPAAVALRTRRTQLVPDVAPAWLAAVAGDDARLDALRRLRPRAWLAVPLVARGQLLGVLGFVMAASRRPITPLLVGVAEELARRTALSADNARLYRLAVRANAAKSAFLGTISHELRTPLTAIIGYSELLQDGLAGPLVGQQADFVRRIRESSDHLLHLVEEVLGFARLQASEEHARVECVDVGVVAEQSVALVAPLAARKGLTLRLEGPPAPVRLDTDATKLRQILVNLLGNAVKFTDRGEVWLRIAAPAVAGAPVVLEVRDTGIGIPPSLLPHVFDPFWQVEQTPTRTRGGAGLGLSVVQQLAHLLGGDVVAESEPGRGSCFRVWLPTAPPHAPDGEAAR